MVYIINGSAVAFLNKMGGFYARYERRLTAAAFIFGFLWDNLTLTRIDLWYDNIVLISYLIIALGGITLLNLYESGRFRGEVLEKYGEFLPLPVQFAFGGLFSGFFVFYSRSGSLAASWPFLLFLGFMLLGNEMFRKRYSRFTFHLSVFFIAVFSYAIFVVPVILGRMGADIFILSGLVSLAVIGGAAFFLSRAAPARFFESRRSLLYAILSVYLGFNALYFTNLIPPLPLALKEIGAYHSVTRTSEGYLVEYEPAPWYLFFKKESGTLHRQNSGPVYVFSSVFAPTDLTAKISHRWDYYDEEREKWISAGKFGYSITGGRDGGYRGYTFKTGVRPGLWRVDVVTERGQIIGRVKFRVERAESQPKLRTAVK